MSRLLALLSEDARTGPRRWRISIAHQRWLVRAFSVGEKPGSATLFHVDGVACWTDLFALDDGHREALKLPQGRWILAVRPALDGELLEATDRLADRALVRGHQLARALRGLHAQRGIHGAISPTTVLIDGDDRPWLIDLPWRPYDDSECAEVGDPALRAPELWEGELPSMESDVYALASLICWMLTDGLRYPLASSTPSEWKTHHREGAPRIPATIDDELAGMLQQCLSKRRELRPNLQALLDALEGRIAPVERPFLTVPASLYRGLEKQVLEALDDGARAVALRGETGTGRTFTLRRLRGQLGLTGRRVLHYEAGTIRSGLSLQRVGGRQEPWSVLRGIAEALADGQQTDDDQPRYGDIFALIDGWIDHLKRCLPSDETVLLWDDFDHAGADLRHFFHRAAHELPTLKLVISTGPNDEWSVPGLDAIEVTGPSSGAWNSWRMRTRLADVRELPVSRWNELVDEFGGRPVALFDALHEDLGVTRRPDFAARRGGAGTGIDVAALFAGDWRRHLQQLARQGAHLQLVETCRRLHTVLLRSGPQARIQLLEIWSQALADTGHAPQEVVALERALAENADARGVGADAALLQARLYCELGWPAQALEVLDDLETLDDEQLLEARRWRTDALLASGRLDEAQQSAQKALNTVGDGPLAASSARPHLKVLALGAQAIRGSDEATSDLLSLAATLEGESVDPRLIARCHSFRAVGFTGHRRLEEATDAYLRALEILESHGHHSRLSPLLLEIGAAYKRRGHLGIARAYYARAQRFEHRGTRPTTCALARVHQAAAEVIFGRFDHARRLLHNAQAIAADEGLTPVLALCQLIAGDLALEEGAPQDALTLYEEALRARAVAPRHRALLHLRSATAHLLAGRPRAAGAPLEEARRLLELVALADLRPLEAILRARSRWHDDNEAARLTALERSLRNLLQAHRDGSTAMVMRQSPLIYRALERAGQTEQMSEVARVFRDARERMMLGLDDADRRVFLERLPDLNAPPTAPANQSRRQRVPPELMNRLRALEEELAKRQQELLSARKKLQKLQEHHHRLESHLQHSPPAQKSTKEPRRGRRPKATREDVVEALSRFGDDIDDVAEHLGVSKRTVYRYLSKFGLQD